MSAPTPELRDELAVLMMMRGVDTGATIEDYQPEYMLRWQDAADNLIASDWFVREMAEAERRGAEKALRRTKKIIRELRKLNSRCGLQGVVECDALDEFIDRADAIAAEPRP